MVTDVGESHCRIRPCGRTRRLARTRTHRNPSFTRAFPVLALALPLRRRGWSSREASECRRDDIDYKPGSEGTLNKRTVFGVGVDELGDALLRGPQGRLYGHQLHVARARSARWRCSEVSVRSIEDIKRESVRLDLCVRARARSVHIMMHVIERPRGTILIARLIVFSVPPGASLWMPLARLRCLSATKSFQVYSL